MTVTFLFSHIHSLPPITQTQPEGKQAKQHVYKIHRPQDLTV